MTRPKIFLTRELPPESMAILRQHSDLTFNPDDRVLTKAEIIAGIQGVDGLLCLLTDSIDDEVLAANPDLKVVANFAVGFNNVDVAAATRRKIPVTNTPGVLTDTTADMAFALLLSAARRVVEGDQFVRAGKWHGWGPLQFLGNDVSGSTLGLIGFGRIAQAVARRANGFDMKIVYWNRTRLSPERESSLGVVYAEMDDVLRQSDYVSVHVALNDETKHLIGARELSLMKPTATIVNTARGPIIDEAALVAALTSGTIASAGLDVYEREPELHPDLHQLPNVVVAPHLGSATIGTRTKMGNMAAENCLAGCRGEVPPNLVNPDAIAH
ncbi:MAG: D-glycerate dehydrogenase [Rubripirellula sp.]